MCDETSHKYSRVLVKRIKDITSLDVLEIHKYVHKCNNTRGATVSKMHIIHLMSLPFIAFSYLIRYVLDEVYFFKVLIFSTIQHI